MLACLPSAFPLRCKSQQTAASLTETQEREYKSPPSALTLMRYPGRGDMAVHSHAEEEQLPSYTTLPPPTLVRPSRALLFDPLAGVASSSSMGQDPITLAPALDNEKSSSSSSSSSSSGRQMYCSRIYVESIFDAEVEHRRANKDPWYKVLGEQVQGQQQQQQQGEKSKSTPPNANASGQGRIRKFMCFGY